MAGEEPRTGTNLWRAAQGAKAALVHGVSVKQPLPLKWEERQQGRVSTQKNIS
jgi:hypothetical protein